MTGNSIINFKNLISKRKKSAPESTEPALVINKKHEEFDEELVDECISRHSLNSLTNGPLNTYVIYINENCCVELAVTQKGSSIQNLIVEVTFFFYFLKTIVKTYLAGANKRILIFLAIYFLYLDQILFYFSLIIDAYIL